MLSRTIVRPGGGSSLHGRCRGESSSLSKRLKHAHIGSANFKYLSSQSECIWRRKFWFGEISAAVIKVTFISVQGHTESRVHHVIAYHVCALRVCTVRLSSHFCPIRNPWKKLTPCKPVKVHVQAVYRWLIYGMHTFCMCTVRRRSVDFPLSAIFCCACQKRSWRVELRTPRALLTVTAQLAMYRHGTRF